jgi:Asp-tRNA(Asn)/Glu-tRNA(Gln) amidotransferase A subunit family amidase
LTEAVPLSHARTLSRQLAAGEVGVSEVVAGYRAVIEACESQVKAFRFLDWSLVGRQVEQLQQLPAGQRGPLFGVPVAVKDIFDTADMPAVYGSQIYAGHRPAVDAASVARLRNAGAIIIGKTVTTEFAFWHAGPTRNPLDLSRTPGGSSSGSCAGLAAGMFPLALGSQTAASTIRPAAYCGIVGYKPSRQWISRAGVKALAGNTLDAIGVFGQSIDDVALLAEVLAGVPMEEQWGPAMPAPVIATWQGCEWRAADSCATAAVMQAMERLEGAGATIMQVTPSAEFDSLIEHQKFIMAREAACDLAVEHLNHRDLMSETLAGFLDEGIAIPAAGYQAALDSVDHCKARIDDLFSGADILAAPSTTGEAPRAEAGTGNPDMSRTWTVLNLPSLTIPCGTGPDGLPLGLQLAARPGQDALLLRAARWVESTLRDSGV